MVPQPENPDLSSNCDARWVVKDEVVRLNFVVSMGDDGIVAAARFDRVSRVRGPG